MLTGDGGRVVRSMMVLACVALLLPACSDGATPVPEVQAISQATTQAGSARMLVEMTMEMGAVGSTSMVMEGVTTLGGTIDEVEAELEGRIELPGAAGIPTDGSLRMVDGRVFASGLFAQSLGHASEGWIEVDEEQREAFAQLGGGGMDPTDPTALLASIQAATGLRAAGSETVRGEETRHLEAEVTYLELMQAQDADLRERLEAQQALTGQDVPDDVLDRMMAAMEELPVELDLWVDADDRIRRTRMEVDLAPLFSAAMGETAAGAAPMIDEARMTMTFEMFDFGVPVEVEVPDDLGTAAGPDAGTAAGRDPVLGMAGSTGTATLTIDDGPWAGTYEGEGTCRTTDLGQGTELDVHLQVRSDGDGVNVLLRTPFADGPRRATTFTLWGGDGRPESGDANAVVAIGPAVERGAREFVDVDFRGDVSDWQLEGSVRCRADDSA